MTLLRRSVGDLGRERPNVIGLIATDAGVRIVARLIEQLERGEPVELCSDGPTPVARRPANA